MKAEYLRHEYTWSNHGITGNVLGWGITASSTPKSKTILGELEKLASMAEPDRVDKLPVEELAYSPAAGFVKMTVIPCDAGEDKRKNKKVFLYQPRQGKAGEASLPEVYLAPHGEWKEEGKSVLPSLWMETIQDTPENILMRNHVYDRLPDFLRAVFWCLCEKKQSLNLVAPSWKKEEFAKRARELMYAIHDLLPETLRKKAGYISFTEEETHREAFCFSQEAQGNNVLNLDTFAETGYLPAASKMEEYFFFHLAELLVQDREKYNRFMEKEENYLGRCVGGNILKKLQWIFYIFCRENGKEALKKTDVLVGIPELFYWASGEKELEETAEKLVDFLRQERWSPEEREEYVRILAEGYTGKAQDRICAELDWMLQKLFLQDAAEAGKLLTLLQEKNRRVYTCLLLRGIENTDTWQSRFFHEKMTSFSSMEEYLSGTDQSVLSSEVKNQMIMAGIHLLNEDLFKKDSFVYFDHLINDLDRKEQWAEILKDFVRQLEAEAAQFDDEQLETACYVEQLLKKYSPGEAAGTLMKEKKKRQGEFLTDVEEDAEFVPAAMEEKEENGSLAETLLVGFPQGFLTGCAWFLSSYALTIGHWKIAVGMAGIWILFMLNYEYLLMHKEKKYVFWKNLGLCILEGYVIKFVANLFISQKIRLYYFILLGVLAVGVEIFNIVRMKREKEEE